MKKIREIDAAAPAIIHRKYSRDYACYYGENGQITANSILKRLDGLVIAPMWTQQA